MAGPDLVKFEGESCVVSNSDKVYYMENRLCKIY